MWWAILAAAAGCYLAKLVGMHVPQRVLDDARVRYTTILLPVTLLAALAATQAFTDGHRIVFDARTPAMAVAAVAVLLRAPFLVVVGLAVATAALTRLLL